MTLPAQQVLAWSGALLKIFDVGAKWTAAAILLQVFADVPTLWGVLLTGSVTVVYSVVGGLWADALTDMSQFIIQVIAGTVMLAAVLARLGGVSALWTVWGRLPTSHSRPFVGQYTLAFAIVYLLVNFLSYNGGTWNLAQRFIASPNAIAARKAALLSASLYLAWPLVLFFPMWVSPLLLPHLADPSQSYALLTKTLLPQGLIGLVLAVYVCPYHGHTATSSDANAISAVVVQAISSLSCAKTTNALATVFNSSPVAFAPCSSSPLVCASRLPPTTSEESWASSSSGTERSSVQSRSLYFLVC